MLVALPSQQLNNITHTTQPHKPFFSNNNFNDSPLTSDKQSSTSLLDK